MGRDEHHMRRFFHNSSIRTKAFAASVVLWICLIGLGTNAYVTLDTSADGLATLATTDLPRQQAVADLANDLITTHVKIFRYVSWTSSGVDPELLALLSADALTDLDALQHRLETLTRQLAPSRTDGIKPSGLAEKWQKYHAAAREILQTDRRDAGKAALMLGGADNDYQLVASDLARISASAVEGTRAVTQQLAVAADLSKRTMALVGSAGVLVSMMVTLLVGGSIVRPIRSVTRIMTQMSGGDMDVAIGYRDRRDEIGQMVQAILVFRENTERHSRLLEHLAHHDSLTDLPNRALLRERLERACHGQTMALLFLDLDNFKNINDTLGHPVGDELLRAVSARLRECVRGSDSDMIARLGGDEFAILQFADDQPAAAAALAQRIIEVIGAPYGFHGHRVQVGASIGIALSPKDGTNPDQLLRSADIALYRAKSEGRATWRFFTPEMVALAEARRELELELRTALQNGEFALFYQPIVDLGGDEICGVEALLRWRHPRRGLVSPHEFIPLAEEIGLIMPLGEWTLRQACSEAARWPKHIKLAVNLSPVQFNDSGLVPMVAAALAAAGLPEQRLELDITEAVLMRNTKPNLATLRELRSLGVRIAMDDFGIGHSSLSYLRSFPFDKIKIDSSFVRNTTCNAESLSIVRAVAGLGITLGMRTTAEGVETGDQLETVRAAGCSEVQGFVFSPPVPPRELIALLSRPAGTRDAA
jgi:diguanylate cyclase (GGDEF)-like protein